MLTAEDRKFTDEIESKKIIAARKDRSLNTDKILNKLDELKTEPPEPMVLPTEMKVEIKGAEIVTIKGEQGNQGEKGDKGEPGESITGPQGPDGVKGEDSTVPGPQGPSGVNGHDGENGLDGKDGQNGQDGSSDTALEVADKLNTLTNALEVSVIKGSERFATVESVSFLPRSLDALYDVNLTVRPTNNQTLVYNATTNKWIAGTASGGGTPGGSNTQVQFNDNGAFGGASGLVYIKASGNLGLGTIAPQLQYDILGATATVNQQVIRRGTQAGASDGTLPTALGTPYLLIGGLEYKVGSGYYATIGFGGSAGNSFPFIPPIEVGAVNTSISGRGTADYIIAVALTTASTPVEAVRVYSNASVSIGGAGTLGNINWVPSVGTSKLVIDAGAAGSINTGATLSLGGRTANLPNAYFAWASIGGLKENSGGSDADGYLALGTSKDSVGGSTFWVAVSSVGYMFPMGTTNTQDFGKSGATWRTGYFGTSVVIAGGTPLTTTNQTGTGSIVLAGSPTLTGSPLAPTQSANDNSTKIATTAYVDSAVLSTNYKEAVKYGSVAALPSIVYANGASGVGATLTGVALAALSLDGAAPGVADRVLIKNQASDFQNGIYVVTQTGSGIAVFILTRATDFDQAADIKTGDTVFVTAGNTLANTSWAYTGIDSPTMGTTSLTFVQVSADLIVGQSVILSGTTTRVLYDNAGIVGEYQITGTGKVVMDTAPQISTIELGAATDTTLSRLSAGVIAVEGREIISDLSNRFQLAEVAAMRFLSRN